MEKIGDQGIVLYQLFFIYNYMIFKNKYSITMFINVFINIFINLIIKHYLITLMKPYNHKMPLLGTFCRPIDSKCNNLTLTGYGMPSGHSQVATFISAFYYFLYKNNEDFSIPKFIITIIIAIFIMGTRYTSKMHTIQQIIIGSLLGICIAYFMAIIISYLNIL